MAHLIAGATNGSSGRRCLQAAQAGVACFRLPMFLVVNEAQTTRAAAAGRVLVDVRGILRPCRHIGIRGEASPAPEYACGSRVVRRVYHVAWYEPYPRSEQRLRPAADAMCHAGFSTWYTRLRWSARGYRPLYHLYQELGPKYGGRKRQSISQMRPTPAGVLGNLSSIRGTRATSRKCRGQPGTMPYHGCVSTWYPAMEKPAGTGCFHRSEASPRHVPRCVVRLAEGTR